MIGELTNHLWQSTLFAAAAGLLTLAFRKNRAQVRYWLWLSASLKFFVPFALLMSLGSHFDWAPAARSFATPVISDTMVQIAEPFPESVTFVPAAPRGTDWTPVAIFGLWVCGFVAIGVMRLRLWLRIRAALRTSTILKIPAAVEIRSSPGLLEPGVVGSVRPVLLLPEGIAERLTQSQLETVLAHELCHVKRRDNLFAAIHMVAEGLFWFHPLVWWIGSRLVEERERACDEGVLSLCGEPRVYAEAILNVCKLYVESPLACVSGVTGANLKRRIEAIMTRRTGQQLNSAKKFLLAGAGMAAVAVPVIIGIASVHPPAVQAQASPILLQAAQPVGSAPAQTAAQIQATPVPFQNRRLVAMLFDFATMTSNEQARARQSAIDFVRGKMGPADVVAVLRMDKGKVTIVQDFTDDRTPLEEAIRKVPVADTRLAVLHIEAVAELLAPLPQKKALLYFSSGIAQSDASAPDALQKAIEAAKKANLVIYPVDSRGILPQMIGQGPAPGARVGGGGSPLRAQIVPASLSTQRIVLEDVPQYSEPPRPQISGPSIEDIEFLGARRVPQPTLKAIIASHAGGVYDIEALRRDSQHLLNTGRFSSVVLGTEQGSRGFIVRFVVVERPMIRSIEYQGDDTVTVAEIVERFQQRNIKLRVETLFDKDELGRAAETVQELIAERGGQNITVTPLVETIPPSSVKITFRVEKKQ